MTQNGSSSEGRKPRLAFIVTEDWFFVSHFLPMAEAARDLGYDVVVITRVVKDRAAIEAAGARVIALDADRRSLNPLGVIGTILRLRTILRGERPALVHCIALRSIVVGGAAARLAGISRRVYAITGFGFLAAWKGVAGRLACRAIAGLIRGPLAGQHTRYVFENEDDPRLMGLSGGNSSVTILGGAGIDPARMQPSALPPTPPLKLAFVARMLWSKGADLAVEAVSLARSRGADVTLTLVGAPDPANPRAISEHILNSWNERDGVAWLGFSRDIAGVWANHHAAIMPSRGGEGLPRAMLEAAACGRPVITTDVPGCRTFVRDGVDGFVVAADDAPALADAIMALWRAPEQLAPMALSIRQRLLAGYTIDAVKTDIARVYAELASV